MKNLAGKIAGWAGATVIAVVLMIMALIMIIAFSASASAPATQADPEEMASYADEADYMAAFDDIEPAAGAEKGNKDCGTHYDWIGMKANNGMFKKAGKPFRVLPPNAMMTMDHNLERINIHVDDNGIIEDVKCG